MSEPKKIGEVLSSRKMKTENNQLAVLNEIKLKKQKQTEAFIQQFQKRDPAGKFEMVKNQVKGLQKTHETVDLPGRVKVKEEPEVLYIMVLELFTYSRMNDKNLIRTVVEILIDTYGWMALQDIALFFKKIKSGLYGEVYGKMNGMWITGKIVNFQKSVEYNLIRDQEAEHFKRKEMDGCRDLTNYYNDITPEIIE
jgi:hypothetical protein